MFPSSFRKLWPFFLTLTLLSCACGEADLAEEEGAELEHTQLAAVAGNWRLSARVAAIARSHNVPVTDPPAISDGGRCPQPGTFTQCYHPACIALHPGTKVLQDYIFKTKFANTGITLAGSFFCRRNSSKRSHLSVHAIGRAIDIKIPYAPGDQANNTVGDEVANWLVEHAEFIGIQRVIWDGSFWNGRKGMGTLGSNPHRDHIHVELSVDGAAKRTPFFTNGPPATTCLPVCYGTAAVRSDCSWVDCAATGTQCLDGPVARCSDPRPPEPSSAVPVAGATPPFVTPIGPKARFTFTPPTRLFDTRSSAASSALTRGGGSTTGPLLAKTTSVYKGHPSIFPAGTLGGWFNVAAVPSEASGYLTLYQKGSSQPPTSNLNYLDETVSNAVPVSLVGTSDINIYAHATTHAIVDMYGRFAAQGDGLTTAGPTRIYDSRSLSSPLKPMTPRVIEVRNAPPGTTGVVASIAVIGKGTSGYLTAHACGTTPSTSHINHPAKGIAANVVVTPIKDGKFCVSGPRAVDFVIDVTGYFSKAGKLSYQAISPTRLMDTRAKTSLFTNRLASKQTIELPIQSLTGMPKNVWGVVTNLTTVGPDRDGFLTTFPCGATVPGTSALNFAPGQTTGAANLTPIGPKGTFCVFAQARTHVIVDLVGVWVHDASSPLKAKEALEFDGDDGEPESPGDVPEPTDPEEMDPASEDPGMTAQPEPQDPETLDQAPSAQSDLTVEESCSSTGSSLPSAPWLIALALGALIALRRRR